MVLVTGGSGYVASFCIVALLNAGWRVRTTLRDSAKAPRISSELASVANVDRLEFAQADLNADEEWDQAMAGCSYVLHIASPLPATSPKKDDELVRPAREGTLRILRAAARQGARRVVMTSSLAAISYGSGSRQEPFTEEDWSVPDPTDTSAYERSKIAAERAAWAWHAEHPDGVELVTICPGAILGPAIGRHRSASAQIVAKLIDGSLPGLPRISFPVVDVRDVADLHVRALTAEAAAGQRYIASGPVLWMADIAETIRQECPSSAQRVPRRRLPDWLVRLSALFDPVTRSRLFELGKYRPVSNAKALRDLGWAPRPAATTIRDTVASVEGSR
ncbi:hypothetical protein LL06_17310 [Hoeflea sp. BAL378]|nr:hypothetical protein LL06_17310 [Hoeflea sp. BAL378]